MGGFSGAMFTSFSAAAILIKCSTIYPTMKSIICDHTQSLPFMETARCGWHSTLAYGEESVRNSLTTFTDVFIEQFVGVNVHSSVSSLWDTVEELTQVTQNCVSLEKEFLLYGHWLLLLVVIPYLLWALGSSEPKLASTSGNCAEPAFCLTTHS